MSLSLFLPLGSTRVSFILRSDRSECSFVVIELIQVYFNELGSIRVDVHRARIDPSKSLICLFLSEGSTRTNPSQTFCAWMNPSEKILLHPFIILIYVKLILCSGAKVIEYALVFEGIFNNFELETLAGKHNRQRDTTMAKTTPMTNYNRSIDYLVNPKFPKDNIENRRVITFNCEYIVYRFTI